MEASPRWERVGAATGIAFVVLIVVSFAIVPETPPGLDEAAGKIRSFYVDNSSSLQASAYLTGVAAFFFLWFLGSLRATLQRAEGAAPRVGRIVTAAGATALAIVLLGTAVNDVLATRIAAESDQFVTRALYELQALAFAFAAFPLAAFVGAVSVVSHRTALLAPLFTWLGFLLVPAWLVAGFGVFVQSGTFSSTGGFGFAVVLVWLGWFLALSASLLRGAGAPARAMAR